MPKYYKPNYKKSIITVPATISSYLGIKHNYPINQILRKELRKNYKNIVFILFDGLGKSIINKNLSKDNILRINTKSVMHSVFPPTTTAATTSYITCSYPSEHGWLGWNMYFEDLNQTLDLFTARESFTQVEIEDKDYVRKTLPLNTVFDKMNNKKDYLVATLYPSKLRSFYEKNYSYRSTKEMFSKIKQICNNSHKNILYCYNESPDDLMHEYGTESVETKDFLNLISSSLEKLQEEMKDTLIIISADHGQIDVDNRIYIHQYSDICDMLEIPPYLDSRTLSFKIKHGRKVEFYNLFNKYFGKEYVLLTKQTVIKKKLFGPQTDKLDKYLGDFVAIGIGKSIIQYTNRGEEHLFNFKGHHAGLTKEELEVPLIMIAKK